MNEALDSGQVNRVPSSLRRFGAGLAEQVRLRAKFAAAIAVASGAVAAASPAGAEEIAKPLPSAQNSLFLVTDTAKAPLGVQIGPEMDLVQYIDPTIECGSNCKIELRCPGGTIAGTFYVERIEDDTVFVPVDKMRGQAGLARCPGDEKDYPFLVPEYIALPPMAAKSPAETGGVVPEAATAPEAATVPVVIETAIPDPVPPAAAKQSGAAFEAGVEIPVTSTHDFMSGPGVSFQGTSAPFDSLGGARGVLRTAWNPVAQKPAGDDARFKPRNPDQLLRGNAFRATGGLLYPHELVRSGGFSLDAQGGVDVGAAFLSVGAYKNVAVDKQGSLADIPGYTGVTAITEVHGELAAHFGERLRVALGLRYGQSPFSVQTRAAASSGARMNFVNVNAGAGVQF
ncbi:hypothetical protein HYW83_04425 [Candidatus Peregrinibacteria bacterium]|nr:hypothetical protein [Candidatus Peregrinibacteria bacterium]